MKKVMYEITKRMMTGVLRGMEFTEFTSARFVPGEIYRSRGSQYRVVQVRQLTAPEEE